MLGTDAAGNKVWEQRYKPDACPERSRRSEERLASGAGPTDLTWALSRREAGVGSLQQLGARDYSPILGRFISADTIVPGPGNPQNLNRYSYVGGRVMKMVDPSGHCGQRPDGAPVCMPNSSTATAALAVEPASFHQNPVTPQNPTQYYIGEEARIWDNSVKALPGVAIPTMAPWWAASAGLAAGSFYALGTSGMATGLAATSFWQIEDQFSRGVAIENALGRSSALVCQYRP